MHLSKQCTRSPSPLPDQTRRTALVQLAAGLGCADVRDRPKGRTGGHGIPWRHLADRNAGKRRSGQEQVARGPGCRDKVFRWRRLRHPARQAGAQLGRVQAALFDQFGDQELGLGGARLRDRRRPVELGHQGAEHPAELRLPPDGQLRQGLARRYHLRAAGHALRRLRQVRQVCAAGCGTGVEICLQRYRAELDRQRPDQCLPAELAAVDPDPPVPAAGAAVERHHVAAPRTSTSPNPSTAFRRRNSTAA